MPRLVRMKVNDGNDDNYDNDNDGNDSHQPGQRPPEVFGVNVSYLQRAITSLYTIRTWTKSYRSGAIGPVSESSLLVLSGESCLRCLLTVLSESYWCIAVPRTPAPPTL